MHAKSLQLCPALFDLMDCSLPGSSVHGILQARVLEWVAIVSSRDLPNPRIKPTPLTSSALAGAFFTPNYTWKVLKVKVKVKVAQFCLSLCDPKDCSLPGFSVHGILQASILEQGPIPFSRDLPDPGIKFRSPALQADLYLLNHQGSSFIYMCVCVCVCVISFQRRQWHPTPVLLPGQSHGWRILVGCSPWGHEESDTTEQLHFHFSLLRIGEGNGNPLQCSCLENPRDGVAQSQTWLKWLSSSIVSFRFFFIIGCYKILNVLIVPCSIQKVLVVYLFIHSSTYM